MTDRDRTLAAMQIHGWEIVRLRGKKPVGAHWQITKDPAEVSRWLDAGHNIGLVCHERTGVAVLDPDKLVPWAELIDMLGQPAVPWVLTGSGRLHYYIAWESDLPAKLLDADGVLGEIQRGPGLQQVVLPPSVHPDSGQPYRWITESFGDLVEPIDPTGPLPELPGLWRAYLRSFVYGQRAR